MGPGTRLAPNGRQVIRGAPNVVAEGETRDVTVDEWGRPDQRPDDAQAPESSGRDRAAPVEIRSDDW